jgi:peptidase M28-like protein
MRPAILAFFVFVVAALCLSQKLQFSPAEREEVVENATHAPESDEQRALELKQLFSEAGCRGPSLREQKVDGAASPNVICDIRGEGPETIIIGAHYDRASAPAHRMDNWTGAALLPALYKCLRDHSRRHRMIFVDFADAGNDLAGAEYFVTHLSSSEQQQVQAMINLDVLGLSTTKVWTAHSDKELVQSLVHLMYAMKLPASQIDIAAAGSTDSEPFASRRIPQITIHSLTQPNLAGAVTPFRPGAYYDSYRLLCGYLAYLDATLKPRSRAE